MNFSNESNYSTLRCLWESISVVNFVGEEKIGQTYSVVIQFLFSFQPHFCSHLSPGNFTHFSSYFFASPNRMDYLWKVRLKKDECKCQIDKNTNLHKFKRENTLNVRKCNFNFRGNLNEKQIEKNDVKRLPKKRAESPPRFRNRPHRPKPEEWP